MIDQYPSPNGVLTSLIWRKTAAGGETSLSGYDNASQALSYTPGQEQVYLNGILLVRGDDYTATNGTSITGLAALTANDFVQINCYNNFSVASLPSTSITGEISNNQITSLATSKLTGTIANNQLANSSITINGTPVSLGGSVSLPGDIESVTAGTGLSGGGTSGALTLTNSMATEITAKGDLIVGTGNATFDNLPAGESGATIVADSAATTGLRYQSAYNGNGVINGGLDIWQRGTSFALTTPQLAYTADRWLARHLGTNVTYSQQASGLTGFQYGIRVQRPNGVSGTDAQVVYYQLETADSYRFAGQAVAISFYAKAGANFSATSSILNITAISGTGTNQNIGNGAYTGQATIVNQNVTLTTSYQRFTVTGTVNSNATQIGLLFGATPVGTAGANDWYEITGLQLELGSVATSFKRAGGGTLQGELAACQRYFQKSYNLETAPGAATYSNAMSQIVPTAGTGAYFLPVRFVVSMRVAPTMTVFDPAGTSGTVDKGGNGKTALIQNFGVTGGRVGTNDATSTSEINFQYTASSEL